MKVAIGKDHFRLVEGVEGCRWFFVRLQVVDLSTMFSLQVDELDVVLFGHRVRHLSDIDGDLSAFAAFDRWHMILDFAIGST